MNIIKNKNNKWWQLFRAGSFTDNSGREFKADTEKIDAIIGATKNREYANDEIPICIGHCKEDSPKWGAFNKTSFKRAGELLLGKYEYLVSEFAETIEKKMFDKVSIALYPDLAIKHIAILGVQQPAVKGLESIQLNEDMPATEIEFMECAEYELNRTWLNYITTLFSAFISSTENKNTKNSEGTNMKTPEQLIQENQEFSEKLNAAKAEVNTLIQKVSDRDKELEILKKSQLQNEIKEFCESPQMIKKITPALQPHAEKIYLDLNSINSEFEFSEGDNKVKSTLLDSFKKILSALPEAVEFGEHADKTRAAGESEEPDISEFAEMYVNEGSMELHKKALKIQSDEKCSYAEAVRKAARQE